MARFGRSKTAVISTFVPAQIASLQKDSEIEIRNLRFGRKGNRKRWTHKRVKRSYFSFAYDMAAAC